MENFLTTHEGLLELVKGEAAEPTVPTISNIFKEDQLAFEDHFRQQLPRGCLSMS